MTSTLKQKIWAPLSVLRSLGVLLWLMLIVVFIASAIAVVWIKHQVRLTSTQLHLSVKQEYHLKVEEGRLLLEYNHLLSRTRIEQLARSKLGMTPIMPAQERVVLLPENELLP